MPNRKNGKSSAEYYKDNPQSAEKKRAYQREYNKSPKERAKRSELVKLNREAQKRGNGKVGDGKDYDHATGKLVDKSVNRGRNGRNGTPGTNGDKRARGGKKK